MQKFQKRRALVKLNQPANTPRLVLTFGWGLNENTTPESDECSEGYNFDLAINQSSLEPRKPFDLKGTATNAGATTGILQLVKQDNSETTLTVNGSTVYLWDGASSFTSKVSVTAPALLREAYWSLTDVLIISDVNKNNVVAKWDGTTYAALVTGLASAVYAKYVVVHNNRVWLFNITYGATSYPHMILVCKFEDITNWDIATRGGASTVGGGSFSTGLEAFYLFSPDLKPINEVVSFQNVLIMSTEGGRMWQLSGTNSKDYQFTDFFDTEPAVGYQSVASIGNDVIFVGRGGEISLLSATQNFGNVRTFSMSRWIPTTASNMGVPNCIVYDVLGQRVLFFISGKVLVLFKDLLAQDQFMTREGKSPWSVYTTNDVSNFNAQAAKYMRIPGTQNYSVFWGDSVGRIFDLNGAGSMDAGLQGIPILRRSRHIGTEAFPPNQPLRQSWPWIEENIIGRIVYRRITPINVTVGLDWDDEYNTGSNVLSLKGPPVDDSAPYWGGSIYWGGTNYYNAGFAFAKRVSSMSLSPGGKGPGFYVNFSTTTNVPFQIDALEFD